MLRSLSYAGAITVAALALYVSQWTPPSAPRMTEIHQGRNNTVLFLTNCEHGLAMNFLAMAYTLLVHHPEIEVHYASFKPMARRLERISEHARQKQPSARSIVYHELPDLVLLDLMIAKGRAPDSIVHGPGIAGVKTVIRDMTYYVSPWSAEQHMRLFNGCAEVMDKVDPALVVLDTTMRPAIHAARNRTRLQAVISALHPAETFPLDQPYLSWLWKYPVMGSGIPFPVPWSRLVENIYINMLYYWAMLRMVSFSETQKELASQGLTDPVSWYNIRADDVPYFSQALPGASIPLDVYPPNVTLTGPIILSTSRAEEESPALTEWLARGPTVLVSLGSLFVWSESQAIAMAQALVDTLASRSDLQVLWKFMKAPDATYGDEFRAPLQPYIDSGRLKIESWLEVHPFALLETGHIVASVHHGGAGCYSEALASGVPQLILPQWLDHYSFAQLATSSGVGIWGCPKESPWWTSACLRDAFAAILGGEFSDEIRSKAKYFGDIVQKDPGQNIVAREVAKLAASGY
ncbi:hypothetical protein F4808DRAFT_471677 [Astrocystis sublimbata]|nr:hypothetical protein F4808DRAFT_471677 [Astrocystis sublimbata]